MTGKQQADLKAFLKLSEQLHRDAAALFRLGAQPYAVLVRQLERLPEVAAEVDGASLQEIITSMHTTADALDRQANSTAIVIKAFGRM